MVEERYVWHRLRGGGLTKATKATADAHAGRGEGCAARENLPKVRLTALTHSTHILRQECV